MPLVRIDLPRSLFVSHRGAISAAVRQAQQDVAWLGVPADDVFQVFSPHDEDELVFHPTYLGVKRRTLVSIQLVMVRRYPVAAKQELFSAVIKRLVEVGLRSDDVLVSALENQHEDWLAGPPGTTVVADEHPGGPVVVA